MHIQNYQPHIFKSNENKRNKILHYKNFIEKGFGELHNIWRNNVVILLKEIEKEINLSLSLEDLEDYTFQIVCYIHNISEGNNLINKVKVDKLIPKKILLSPDNVYNYNGDFKVFLQKVLKLMNQIIVFNYAYLILYRIYIQIVWKMICFR